MAQFALNPTDPFLLTPAIGQAVTIANLDSTNSIYVGPQMGLYAAQAGDLTQPDVDEIPPGGYVIYDGSEQLYGLAAAGQPSVRVSEGAVGYFQPSRAVSNATISVTPPANPKVGDIWFDEANDNQMNEWDGSAWVPVTFGTNAITAASVTTALLAAGAVTAAKIAAGTIVAGIINGTTVIGATIENSATDPKTSINPDGSITMTDASGNVLVKLDPNTTSFIIKEPALLSFPSGQSWEESPSPNISVQVGGTSPAQYIQIVLQGPATTTAGAHDRVWEILNSAAEDDSSSANLEFLYQGSNGVFHEQAFLDITGFNILAGSIVAVDPGSSPAVPASWHTISLQNGYTAGTNNGFTDVPQVRMMADNKTLAFKGSLTVPSSPSSGVWGTLPAGFPNANLGGPYGLGLVGNYTGGTSDHIQVQNNSNLSLGNYSAHGGITFNISCVIQTQ